MSDNRPRWRPLLIRLSTELAVIVAGVLIALWADGWVTERADREIERSRIEALLDNVHATRARLQEASEDARSARDALITTAYRSDPTQGEDVVIHGLVFGSVFTPEMNVYADLKSSGDLALLTNGALRQALARMDAAFEQLALLQDDLVTVQQLNFDPFLLREFALGGTLGPLLGLGDLPLDPPPSSVDVRVLRNLALFKLDLVSQLLSQYSAAMEALNAVEAAMGTT